MKNEHEILRLIKGSIDVDPVATGVAAREYRESNRLSLHEVAKHLKTPTGVQMTYSNLSHYESSRGGDKMWDQKFADAFVAAVRAAVRAYEK